MNLSSLILASLVAGGVFGAILNSYFPTIVIPLDNYLLTPLSQAFLRLIQFVVVPIVFCSMILGLNRIQSTKKLGQYTGKLLTIYVITTTIAVVIGMIIALILQPGAGLTGFTITGETTATTQKTSIISWLINLIPVNPFEALSKGNLLQTIFSAALIGVGIQLIGDKAASLINLLEIGYAVSEKILSLILYVAPLGVFALISSVVATQGLMLLVKLFLYVLGLVTGTAIMISLYTLILFFFKAQPIHYYKSFFPAFSLGFGTASSNAALPLALQNAQESYGMSSEIASFAIPLGTALKRDGAAVLQGFNALFIAQVYHVPLSSSLILAIALSSFLVSFSTPGVPGAGVITMTTVLSAAGLPLEGVAIVAGVDRLIDGLKTVLNLIGNTTNAVILSHWEKPILSLEEGN